MDRYRLSTFYRWLAVLVLVVALGVALAPESTQASPSGGITQSLVGGGGVCKSFPGGFIERIVMCLTSTQPPNNPTGAIPKMVKLFLENSVVKGLMAGINGAIFVLGTLLIGIKISFLPDARVTKKELWILMFKITGLMWFSANVYDLYVDAVSMVNGLMNTIAGAAAAGMCSVSGTNLFWKMTDCLFNKVTGFGAAAGLAGGLLGLVVATFMSGPAGVAVAFGIIYFATKLVFTVGRVIHLYVMSFIGLGYIFCVSFLFVPMLFFQETKAYFDKWLRLTVGYILTPIFLFCYLGFAFIAIKEVVLCGSKSLFVALGGVSAGVCSSANPTPPGVVILSPRGNMVGNNLLAVTASSDPSEAAAGEMTPTGNSAARAAEESSMGQGSAIITINSYKLDFDKIGTPSAATWITKVLTALIASCLLMYILYELLEYIPELAADLAQGGYRAGSIAGDRALGEVFALTTLKLIKDLPTDVAKGFVNGGKAGAIVAAAQTLNKYRQDVSRTDGKELR